MKTCKMLCKNLSSYVHVHPGLEIFVSCHINSFCSVLIIWESRTKKCTGQESRAIGIGYTGSLGSCLLLPSRMQ